MDEIRPTIGTPVTGTVLSYLPTQYVQGEATMAKGKKCPHCGHTCYLVSEEEQKTGSYIVYKCNNGKCKEKYEEKVFETKTKK